MLIFYDSQSMIEFYQLIIYPIAHSRTKYINDRWVSMWTHHEINQGQDSFIYFLNEPHNFLMACVPTMPYLSNDAAE